MSEASPYNFKRITVVPSAKDFIDIVLSKTQRKTPTVIHKQYKISRIRSFYMRKVKYTQQNFHEKLSQILDEFPKLGTIHPFFADLINVFYEADHYKLALGQLNIAMHLIDKVGQEYVKLLKYADSLYRAKQLKRAALGRMVTVMKKQANNLQYLEEVRQHLSRLPSIDPDARTLLLCGFPNVGKSSFMNKITRADVEVQPYAFTTKSLYVGHTYYDYLRYQVIDTPGLLDRPLDCRNNIEMLGITALAYINCTVVYIMDVSEQCGESLESQVHLFNNIRPMFRGKPIVVALNKVDVTPLETLPSEKKDLLETAFEKENIPTVPMCALAGENMDEAAQSGCSIVRNLACEKIRTLRVEKKLRSKDSARFANRLNIVMPEPRDDKVRPITIPEKVLEKRARKQAQMEIEDEEPKKLEKDLEEELGDDYLLDLKKNYDLPEEWKYDARPEIFDGMNIADFMDPDLEELLDKLEKEEEMLIQSGYFGPDEPEDEETLERRKIAQKIREFKKIREIEARIDDTTKARLPIAGKKRSRSALREEMSKIGIELKEDNAHFSRSKSRSKSRAPSVKRARVDSSTGRVRSSSRTPRDESGVKDITMKKKLTKIVRKSQQPMNRKAMKGEADRKILNLRPKHLLSGKRGLGKSQRR